MRFLDGAEVLLQLASRDQQQHVGFPFHKRMAAEGLCRMLDRVSGRIIRCGRRAQPDHIDAAALGQDASQRFAQ